MRIVDSLDLSMGYKAVFRKREKEMPEEIERDAIFLEDYAGR
mgnify:CR=1 FL=1